MEDAARISAKCTCQTHSSPVEQLLVNVREKKGIIVVEKMRHTPTWVRNELSRQKHYRQDDPAFLLATAH